jgi:RAB protein geranylgeranyltransferase component A
MKTIDFFKRISKYLRSIGYYGDSPYMMCNYGSSEYSQAFSRIGSLFGNVYIVNEDLKINSVSRDGERITAIDINYNDSEISVKEGVIASSFLN